MLRKHENHFDILKSLLLRVLVRKRSRSRSKKFINVPVPVPGNYDVCMYVCHSYREWEREREWITPRSTNNSRREGVVHS